MNLIKIAEKEYSFEEMENWFNERTKKHIELVKKYCKRAKEYGDGEFDELIERAEKHDSSKFEDPENIPYVHLTWNYKCKSNGGKYKYPDGMEEKTNEMTEHHIKNNPHHPEYHCDKKTNLINTKDRDKAPEEMIDATKMKDIDLAEMVSDWCAVSEERGTSPEDWADKNINKRWKFTKYQEALIYELIDVIWDKK